MASAIDMNDQTNEIEFYGAPTILPHHELGSLFVSFLWPNHAKQPRWEAKQPPLSALQHNQYTSYSSHHPDFFAIDQSRTGDHTSLAEAWDKSLQRNQTGDARRQGSEKTTTKIIPTDRDRRRRTLSDNGYLLDGCDTLRRPQANT